MNHEYDSNLGLKIIVMTISCKYVFNNIPVICDQSNLVHVRVIVRPRR